MKKFFELSYDERWLLYYICQFKNKQIKVSSKYVNSKVRDFDTVVFYPILCDATKKSLTMDNFDEKFIKFGELINKFIKNNILEYDESTDVLKLTSRGDVFLESELITPLKKMLPQTMDGEENMANDFWKGSDSNGIRLTTFAAKINSNVDHRIHTKRSLILKFFKYLTDKANINYTQLCVLIMDDNTLTMNFINFICNIILPSAQV